MDKSFTIKIFTSFFFTFCFISVQGQDILTKSGRVGFIATPDGKVTTYDLDRPGFQLDSKVESEQDKLTSINSLSALQNTAIVEASHPSITSSFTILSDPSYSVKDDGQKITFLLAYTNWQSDVQKRINSIIFGLDELKKQPTYQVEYVNKNLKDPLTSLRDSIKISLFTLNNIHILNDTLFNFQEREKKLDELARRDAKLDLINDKASDLSYDIRKQLREIPLYQERENVIKDRLEYIRKLRSKSPLFNLTLPTSATVITPTIVKDISPIVIEVARVLDSLSTKTYPGLRENVLNDQSTVTRFVEEFKVINKGYNEWYKSFVKYRSETFKASKSASVESDFGALPSVSQTLGDVRVPSLNISVLGSRTVYRENSNSTLTARIFTGSVPASLANARSLFLPEVSTFGSQIKYNAAKTFSVANTSAGLSTSKFLTNGGFNAEFNILNKRISTPSSGTTSNPQSNTAGTVDNLTMQLRAGLELVVFKEFLSIYANYNGVAILDNTDKFHDYYQESGQQLSKISGRNVWTYFDIGTRILLSPTGVTAKQFPSSDLYIVVDFNLIFPQIWGQQLIQRKENVSSNDNVIPVFRIGIQKSLGRLVK